MGCTFIKYGLRNKINLNLPARCTGEDPTDTYIRYHLFVIEVVCMQNMNILTVRIYFEHQKWFHAKLEQCTDSAN